MEAEEAQRRLFHLLECGRVGESTGVEDGLNQLALALEAVTRSADEDPGLARWSKEQLEQLVGILIRLCWDLQGDEDAGEKKILRRIFSLALQFSVQGLESPLRSDEQLQRKLLQLLQAVLLGEKITMEPQFSSASIPSRFLASFSAFVHNSQESHIDRQEDTTWSQNILAVLSNHQHFCDERSTGRKDSLAGKRQTLIDATQHYAVVNFGCFRRLTALCVDLVSTDVEADELYERVSLATELLSYVTKLSSATSYRAFLPDTVAEIIKLVTALPTLIKLSVQTVDGYEVQEASTTSLPIFMDTVIGFCELLYSDQVLAQNVRTFLAAIFLDELAGVKLRQDAAEQHLFVVCAPLFVSCFLRLFRDEQFHMTDGKSRRFLMGEETVALVRLRSQPFLLNQARSRSEHLEVVFPCDGKWLDTLVAAAAGLHAQGVRLKPVLELTPPSIHSEEDSATVSMDSLTVASEDDALFGDLFSESGRHSVNSEEIVQPSSAVKKVDGIHNTLLQSASQLLRFLEEFVLSSHWHKPTYEVVRAHVSKAHVDAFLEMLRPQVVPMVKQSRVEELYSEGCSDLIVEVQKQSFDVLYGLVDQETLSEELQAYLFRQVSRGVDGMSRNVLALMAKILINRFTQSGTGQDDPLAYELWQGFVESIVSKIRNTKSFEGELEKVSTILPSWFHMEVLFMAFHSLHVNKRLAVAELLTSSLASCRQEAQAGSPIVVWAMLISRLLFALKYVICHFTTFPKWLVRDLSKQLRFEESTTTQKLSMQGGPFPSWSAILAQRPGQHMIDEQCIAHLFDVDCSGLWQQVLSVSSLDTYTVKAAICDLVEVWTGRTIGSVDELLLERYLFMLGWSILQASACTSELPAVGSGTFTTVGSFFRLGESLCMTLQGRSTIGVTQWSAFLVQALQKVDLSLQEGQVNLTSWDLLRQGTMVTLLLVPLRLESLEGSDTGVLQHIVEGGDREQLLQSLSSILDWYVKAASVCLSHAVTQHLSSQNTMSNVNLILQAGFPKSKRLELLEKAGANAAVVKALLRWDSSKTWSEEFLTVLKKTGAEVDTRFLPVLLNGFPLCSYHGHATLVSCMISLEEILGTLESCLRMLRQRSVAFKIDVLLNTIMLMKVNSAFESLHGLCDTVLSLVLPAESDRQLFSDFYTLKHTEGLLDDLRCNTTAFDMLLEGVVCHAVELMNGIRTEARRSEAFNLRYGAGADAQDVHGWFLEQGSLTCCIDVLDGRISDPVNQQMLRFLLDILDTPSCLQSSFGRRLQAKMMEMDTERLGTWIEQRILGSRAEGVRVSASSAVREISLRFIQSIARTPELADHILDAMLAKLERAFVLYDADAARSYLNALVKLANGEASLKKISNAVTDVISKVPPDDDHLECLKWLLSFLSSILAAHGAHKLLQQTKFSRSKSVVNVQGMPYYKPRVPRGESEQSLQVADGNADGDATSVDEDEDDATSDGELTTMEREHEESSNSERLLASKVCTFTSSGSNFMEQHWYFCYTCDLTVSKGCCSVCAKVCHRGHKVVYSRLSRFFCDCGAGGVRGTSCQCLKPRKYIGSAPPSVKPAAPPELLFPIASNHDRMQLSDSDSDTDSEDQDYFSLSVTEHEEKELLFLLLSLDLETQLLSLCEKLLKTFTLGIEAAGKDEILLGQEKTLQLKTDVLQLKRAYKSGSFDMKIKADYSNSRELRSHLLNGSLSKSLLTISSRGRLAAGEGDKVTIFDVGQLIGQPTTSPVIVDKTTVKPLSKSSVRFELVQLHFNPANESYLVVAGYEDCLVFTVNPRGEVTDRLALELALQDAYIRRVAWVTGSQVELMVVTNKFVKIYDLSQDKICPMHYLTVLEDEIVDAVLVGVAQGQFLAVVLSQLGVLYKHRISGESDSGSRILTEVFDTPQRYRHGKGVSLHFSSSYKLLMASYSDGSTLIGRLNGDATGLAEISNVVDSDQDKKPAGLHHWREILEGSGLFSCLSGSKANSVSVVHMRSNDLHVQHLRVPGSPMSVRVDGVSSYRSMAKERSHALVLYDDGSMHVFLHASSSESTGSGSDSQRNYPAEQIKKLGAAILSSRSTIPPVFPLDFFEKTICITSDVKFGGDILRNTDSEGVKLSLSSDDGFVESPAASGFKLLVFNSNADMVMVGCRVHVGNTSASHIPSELKLFQRSVKLDEGVRCWYDIPFTNSESLLADEEFSLTIGPAFNGTSLPRIDSLEVYARTKEDFGWKEKLEAMLDLDNQGQNSGNALSNQNSLKAKKLLSSSTLDQVFYEIFKVLSAYYSLHRMHSDFGFENHKAKCIPVLEVVFGSDRQSLLQSAARRVLRALSSNKDAYYLTKDMMALSGVARACPVLASKLSKGGFRMSLVVQEFTSQVRTVCKVSLHRPSNLTAYLERNGPSFIEKLVSLLWEILVLSEQLDAQTINDLVVLTVDLIYGYAECRSGHVSNSSISPAVSLLKNLLFASEDAVRSSCSLALSSRLLQVPLPKQTMLVMDDATDSSRTGSVQSEVGSTATSGQVMLDEDSNSASVQYCCDGCSIVPIQRKRWHCTVCPDFDLCEACFEVMEADQLPPPHTRDHPMTAIPIEAEAGADNNELQFAAIDDMTEENMFQLATQMSLQPASAPAVSPVEGNVSCDFTDALAEAKAGSFSASKRLVNSLLLSGLLESLRGWAKTTTGMSAVPIMQLFYRLTTAPSSPFFEASGAVSLEKVVKFLLEELDMQAHMSVRTRSGLGEVVILIFMFFTLLLRHWHQPGSACGPAKDSTDNEGAIDSGVQYDKACALLRQQVLVNFLLNITQQLAHVFKSSRAQESSRASSPCGALLTVRREFAAGSFSPFFTDSYAKSHRGDLFAEFHKLMLESVFRLTYSLLRPGKSDKLSDKEQSVARACPGAEPKLEGWQDVLCGYINNPHTSFVKKYARRLLLHLCGSKNRYYNVRDAWQLNREVKKLNKLVHKSGGFHVAIPYESSVKVLKCLTLIGEVASARPRNWQKYCAGHPDVVRFLLNGSFCFGEELVVQTLKLLSLVFYSGRPLLSSKDSNESQVKTGGEAKKEKKDVEETTSSSDKTYIDMKQAVEQLVGEDGRNLKNFVDSLLLEWNATSVRSEAKTVLSGAWYHGEEAFRVLLLTLLLDRIPILPSYGQNVQEFSDLLSWLLKKGTQEIALSNPETVLVQGCLTGNTIKKVFETLRSQNELLANHPNSRIYNMLVTLVDFDGYYLESEPCLACSSPEIPYTRMKLEAIKAETKFTDNRILVKCTGSHTIQSVAMNVHEPRRSKSIKVLNLYYNNRVVADLSELKNNRSLWKRARSCQLNFGQTELKVEFPIPITACNFMIELDAFYENLQAASLESLQCPRCSRVVTDKHGICSNCHENAYQCRQCRNINYENLDSFLCNECGYSKYGRFEFNFMAKPSYTFDRMENDDDMKKGLAAIETESENAHKRYQQLLVYKKPLLKVVSSIGESEVDSQQKDTLQQLVAAPGSKINKKIAILGVLYGEKCKMAFDSVSKSVQNLQGLRRVLMSYLERKKSPGTAQTNVLVQRHPNRCFGCANTFVGHCLEWLQVLSKVPYCRQQLVTAGILSELFENNIHQGPRSARIQARTVLSAFTEGDAAAVAELNSLIKEKVMYCLEHHRSMDIAACVRDELQLLSETCSLGDDFWEARLRVAFQLLFRSIQVGARHPVIAEHIILPALRIISQACTPPKTEAPTSDLNKPGVKLIPEPPVTKPAKDNAEKDFDSVGRSQELLLVNYVEWKTGATYADFLRRLKLTQTSKTVQKTRKDSRKTEALALKYILRWKRKACKPSLADDLKCFQDGDWVRELVLSACSQSIRQEICALIEVLCSQNAARRTKFLDLFMNLLPASRTAGESAAEYFELLFKMIETEDARLYLTVRGFLRTSCSLIAEEVIRVEAQERSFHTDISQGYTLHKLIELLNKFLQVPNIRTRFMKDDLLSQILEALLVIRGLVVQKTKLISDCGRLLNDLLENLLQESYENKKHFLRACISGLQNHNEERKDRRCLFILEQICNIICPTKPEPAYMLILNKAHTQEEFIRGSMTKNPYSSLEIGPLMRDVKNKICQQLEMIALLEDDYSMELLVAGNIISLDLTVGLVYEQVWRKAHTQIANAAIGTSVLAVAGITAARECPPMTVTYRLQGLDGEATEPMIKELDDEREETQDPEVEFAIADVMRESGGLSVLLKMIQNFTDEELKSGHEQVALVLKLLMFCCKIRGNRQALLQLGALDVLLETANKAFSSAESVERLLLIIECLVSEANESDVGVTEGALSTTRAGTARGQQAAKGVLMFLERLSAPSTSKQHRNSETVARILPYLTYGELNAMEVLVNHFIPYLLDWETFDGLQKSYAENPKDATVAQKATLHKLAVENFVKVTESIKLTATGELLKDLILEKKILSVAIRYLKSAFPFTELRADHRTSPEWMKALELASVPIILSLLRGLSRGHRRTQECLSEEGLLPLLHALEAVSGENDIGARAENLLDTLSDKELCGEGFLSEAVMNLRETTRDEMRRRALQRREELLQELGMSRTLASDGGERIVISKSKIEGLEDVEEEEAGLACMVCREGYKLRPTDMLGTYSYSKRVNIGTSGAAHGRSEWVYTTVSHFNVIHFQCHQEAKRADASLKNPKKEWEGAALRNNETLCNSLFPLRGPSVPLAHYSRCVDTFWDNLNSLGRADGSRLRLLTYDIVLMLGRFATGSSFSIDSKGGGKESNSKLLPFMIQMARHLLDQQGQSQRRVLLKSLQNYLQATSEPDTAPRATTPGTPQRTSSDDNVQFMLVQSLLLHSLDEWQQHRSLFLQRGAVHAYMLHKQGRQLPPVSPAPATTPRSPFEFAVSFSPGAEKRRQSPEVITCPDNKQLFSILQSMLVFIGIIDQLHRYFKVASRGSTGSSSSSSSSKSIASVGTDEPGEPWEVTMKEKLRDVSTMLAFSKELLEWLDDMQSSQDLQEALDVMGALGDAFSDGYSSCDEFFRNALGLEEEQHHHQQQ